MYRALVAACVLVLALPALPHPSSAQGTDSCRIVQPTERLEIRTVGLARVIYAIRPVVTCDGGARITAEEGTLYEERDEVHLIGNVEFHDPDRSLTSDQAVYTGFNGRLYATGNVVFTDRPEGMTIRGPELEYYRATPARPQSYAIATQRPHLVLNPRQPEADEARQHSDEPILVDADRMTMTGNDHFVAIGTVEIRRSDFQAYSNEARMDQIQERMELIGQSRVHAEQFDLTGDRIDMRMPGDRLERIYAYQRASLVGDDLRVDAPELHLYLENDELERMIARSGTEETDARPIATARGFRLEADSLDALTPEQQLERVIAVGNARGESIDTTAIPPGRIQAPAPSGDLASGEHDWIEGDTVTGFFIALPVTNGETGEDEAEIVVDENGEPKTEIKLDRVLAIGSARSLYRLQNNRPEANGRPGLSYVIGEAIELTFDQGELQVADVRGLARGLYLDPEALPADPPDDEGGAGDEGGGDEEETDELPEIDETSGPAAVATSSEGRR